MALTPGTRLGPYEIGAQIGAGGMGEVYRATDTKLKRLVAVKVLPQALSGDHDRLVRFQREAEVLASLNHPNIASIYGIEDGTPVKALVMELVEGPTLADWIAERAGVPVDEALAIARQIADGIAFAHSVGVVHRDLKPANIKLAPGGHVKLLDFGLAKLVAPESTEPPPRGSTAPTMTSPALMTGVGTVLGTAAYMSPEQARGWPVDRRTDIWAFGCVLHEMLGGKVTFAAGTVADTIARILEREPDWRVLPRSTPVRIRALLRDCLQKVASQRLAGADLARVEIEKAQSGLARTRPGRTSTDPRSRPSKGARNAGNDHTTPSRVANAPPLSPSSLLMS